MTDLVPELFSARPVAGSFLPIALALVALEFGYGYLAAHDAEKHFDARETIASVGVAIGNILARVVLGGLAALPFFWLYQHRLLDLPPTSGWTWVVLFFAVEFCYYWFHRASHRMRWFWATHAVHHSATRFNLSAALRLGWTGHLSGAFAFFLPLSWVGFHPLAIITVLGVGLLYQFFLHTHFDVSLGPLEWVLNTPRHHRVHHARNEGCLDRNYGSTLIIFDRVFGTFAEAPQSEPLKFGLRGREVSNNPIEIAFSEWLHLVRDVRKTKGLRRKLRLLISPP